MKSSREDLKTLGAELDQASDDEGDEEEIERASAVDGPDGGTHEVWWPTWRSR